MIKKRIAQAVTLALPVIAANGSVFAQDDSIEEITVIGRQEFIQKEFTATRSGAAVDAAKLGYVN